MNTEPLYRLKPLKWVRNDDSLTGQPKWIAATVLGSLVVWVNVHGQMLWRCVSEEPVGPAPCHSIRDGKAQAEAFYRSRILPALEEVNRG